MKILKKIAAGIVAAAVALSAIPIAALYLIVSETK